jgi:hypothetical protein
LTCRIALLAFVFASSCSFDPSGVSSRDGAVADQQGGADQSQPDDDGGLFDVTEVDATEVDVSDIDVAEGTADATVADVSQVPDALSPPDARITPDARVADARIPDAAEIPDARVADARVPDARVPDATPAGPTVVTCGTGSCTEPEVCCVRSPTPVCYNPTTGGTCGGGGVTWSCDGPEDCDGNACCQGASGSRSCGTGDTCPIAEVCHETADCPTNGDTCCVGVDLCSAICTP